MSEMLSDLSQVATPTLTVTSRLLKSWLCTACLIRSATMPAVSKSVQGDGTRSEVARLSANERIEELARMLGGVDVTRESRANARQMLTSAQAG